jgi:hypothetical protein
MVNPIVPIAARLAGPIVQASTRRAVQALIQGGMAASAAWATFREAGQNVSRHKRRIIDTFSDTRGRNRKRMGDPTPTPPRETKRRRITNGNSRAAVTLSQKEMVTGTLQRKRNGIRKPGVPTRRANRRVRRSNRNSKRGTTRKSRRGAKKSSPTSHCFNGGVMGVQQAYDATAVAGNDHAMYLGHCSTPAAVAIQVSFMALIKAACRKAGLDVRSPEDTLQPGMAFSWYWFKTPINTSPVSFTSTFAAGTLDNMRKFARDMQLQLYTNITLWPAMQPFQFTLTYGGNIYYIHTDKCSIKVDSTSLMKFQNKTPNASGTMTIDANNVNFINGRKYMGKGTGAYYRDNRYGSAPDTYVPFIGDVSDGVIIHLDIQNNQNSLLEPPKTHKMFLGANKSMPLKKVTPGETFSSYLSDHYEIKYVTFIDQWLKQLNNNTYVLSKLGSFAFYGLTKYIDNDTTNLPTFGYEVETNIGMTITKDSRPSTVPVYLSGPGP